MAKEQISMGINLRQNKNDRSSAYGKYYPEVDVQKTLSLRGFAKHMVDHGSLFGRDVIEAVLTKITQCLPELEAQFLTFLLLQPPLFPVIGGEQSLRQVKRKNETISKLFIIHLSYEKQGILESGDSVRHFDTDGSIDCHRNDLMHGSRPYLPLIRTWPLRKKSEAFFSDKTIV